MCRDPETLKWLQETARDAAADGVYSVLFVVGDGRVLAEMRGRAGGSKKGPHL